MHNWSLLFFLSVSYISLSHSFVLVLVFCMCIVANYLVVFNVTDIVGNINSVPVVSVSLVT